MFDQVRDARARIDETLTVANQTMGAAGSAALELGDAAREIRAAAAYATFVLAGCAVFVVLASVAVLYTTSGRAGG